VHEEAPVLKRRGVGVVVQAGSDDARLLPCGCPPRSARGVGALAVGVTGLVLGVVLTAAVAAESGLDERFAGRVALSTPGAGPPFVIVVRAAVGALAVRAPLGDLLALLPAMRRAQDLAFDSRSVTPGAPPRWQDVS